jgi:hypothetical protein
MPVSAASVHLSGATRTAHFLIRYDPSIKATAEVIGDRCEDWFKEISRRLELEKPPDSLIPVFLYRNPQEFSEATGQDKPGEVLGLASSKGYIKLDISGFFAPAERIAGHEIVHVVIFHILGKNEDKLPLWANEGIAKYITSDWDNVDQTILGNTVADGNLLTLSSISKRFQHGQRETLAYAEGASAIKFFTQSYGEPALAELLHKTADTGSFDAAMVEVTGQTASQFEHRWKSSLEKRYGSPQLIRIARVIGLLTFPLLVIAAYLALRRRKRRIIKQYELDEWEEANWRDWGGR